MWKSTHLRLKFVKKFNDLIATTKLISYFVAHRKLDFCPRLITRRSIRPIHFTLTVKFIPIKRSSSTENETTTHFWCRWSDMSKHWSWIRTRSRHRGRNESSESWRSTESSTQRTRSLALSRGVSWKDLEHAMMIMTQFYYRVLVPTQKMPRLITTSASAAKKLMRKADLMGIDAAALEFQEAQVGEKII